MAKPLPRTSEGQDRRELILDCATQLFAEHSYNRTTVRMLADAVGVQSGALFYYFQTKEQILIEIIERGLRWIAEAAEAALATTQDPELQLRRLLHAHLRTLLGPARPAMQVMLNEWRYLDQEAKARIIGSRDRYETTWQTVIDQAAEVQLLAAQDTHLLRLYLLGAVNWSVTWYHEDGGLTVEQLAERMFDMTLHR